LCALAQQRDKNVFILNFHGLGEPLGSESRNDELYWTDPQFFAAILEIARERRDVLITFDDSYESDYSVGLPLLEASKMKARFFVVANRVGQTGFLSGQQIQSLCAAGMTIGSHGMNHRKWPGLSDRELHEEIVEARDRIEQITGSRVFEAACPFGGYNRRVLQRLRTSGYDRVYTSDGGPAAVEFWIQPRNTIVRGDDLQKILGILNKAPSGPKAAWRRLKLLLKRLR
jgi:peptidoglycan/xylan/chitin deacetylase (PgdA/CDA1 family)